MDDAADPRCPECGGPIGQTATYCMHCSADLTDELAAADTDEDGAWDRTAGGTNASNASGTRNDRTITDVIGDVSSATGERDGNVLDPDGLLDNTLTTLVGIVGGVVVGLVGTLVLLIVTGSGWAVAFGAFAWLGTTAYLVRRRTVQGAIAMSGYAVALVLLLVPIIALSPVVGVDGGMSERGGLFVVLLVFAAVPAGIAAVIGWVASRYVPGDVSSEG